MNKKEFAKYTEKIRAMLPFWFKMKKQPKDSLGLQFLNIFGMELADIEKMLDFAYKQTKIDTLSESFTDIVYKVVLPTFYNINTIERIESGQVLLKEASTLYEFFNLEDVYKNNNNINTPDFFFVDKERKIIYVRKPYSKNSEFKFGRIRIGSIGSEEVEEFPLMLHHVWNFFDEMGALLSCPRLIGENNHHYKERIHDVFVYKASSTKKGLLNGISRELGIREHVKWTNTREDLIIKDKMVIANSISIGGKFLFDDEVNITTDGYLLVESKPFLDDGIDVSYIRGLELCELVDKENTKLSNELYNPDGTITELLDKYISLIKRDSSLLWGDFRYNEGMWVTNNEEFSNEHFSFKPNYYDANIKGFGQFGFINKGKIIK